MALQTPRSGSAQGATPSVTPKGSRFRWPCGSALLDVIDALDARLQQLGPDDPAIADWVHDEGLAAHTLELLREMPRIPYMLRIRPAAMLYLAWHARCFDAAFGPNGATMPGPAHRAHAWALQTAMRSWGTPPAWPPVAPLEDAALRNLLAELPRGDPAGPVAAAARLVVWAVEMGERDWLPILLVLPALIGRITAAMVADAVTQLWRMNAFERNRLARLAGCLHAAHPGILPTATRKSMVLFNALRPECTAPLLRLGMMDGWRRDPSLGSLAAHTLGFGPQLLPFVWYSRLTEFEWVLIARVARGLGNHQPDSAQAAAAAAVRRWVALRDVLSVGGPRWGRLGALPSPAARTIAAFLGLPADQYAVGRW